MGKLEFLWPDYYTKIFCFCVHGGAPDLIYPGTSLYEHILWMHLEKNGTCACTFPVQLKEISNVVKVRFTMMYSSRKLNNKKVITTARNFWRQIACSFRRTIHFCATSTRKTLKWIFRFFSPDQHWRHKLFFRQFFRPLYEDKDQKTAIFSCKYLGDTCFNWAETP